MLIKLLVTGASIALAALIVNAKAPSKKEPEVETEVETEVEVKTTPMSALILALKVCAAAGLLVLGGFITGLLLKLLASAMVLLVTLAVTYIVPLVVGFLIVMAAHSIIWRISLC